MSRPPSPSAPDGAAGQKPGAGAPEIYLEPRFCPHGMQTVRGDLQQDIIDTLKPLDNDRLKEGMRNTEFNRKYPPDDWCEEAAPNARVWKICRDEASAYDREMLESWNKTLDVLLIFAGLFSAVSTAFLVESYKTLQPDYSQYVATFLYSAAVAYNASGNALPPLNVIQSPQTSFQRSTTERWINGLWFISLTISLLVALLSILVKQWLDEYRARVSRSAPDHASWARRHALYHTGLRSWGVPVIISCLPLLLHMSLFLFLGGLVLFLRKLDADIARGLLIFLVLILCLYLLSMVLPAYYIACPSTTPVLTHAVHAWSLCAGLPLKLAMHLRHSSMFRYFRTILVLMNWLMGPLKPLLNKEGGALFSATHELNAAAISALVSHANDHDILVVAAEAMGHLPPNSLDLLEKRHLDAFHLLKDIASLEIRGSQNISSSTFAAASLARCWRAYLSMSGIRFFPRYMWPGGRARLPDLRGTLGVEGALLCALVAWEPSFTETCGIRNLVAALRGIDWIPASSLVERHGHPLPPRLHPPFCLLWLRTAARIVEDAKDSKMDIFALSPHFYSLVCLVFCATQFAWSPDWEGQAVATECLAKVVHERAHLHPKPARIIWTNNVLDSDRAWGSRVPSHQLMASIIDALYTMLSHMEEYNIHPDVAALVAPYVASLAVDYEHGIFWSDHQGLSAFMLSDDFERHTASVEKTVKYTKLLASTSQRLAAYDTMRLTEFLRCCAVLASRASRLNFSPDQYYEHFHPILLSIKHYLDHRLLEHTEYAVLSYFLTDTDVLDQWMELAWRCRCDSPDFTQTLRTFLPSALALALARRRRMRLEVGSTWAHVLFANPLVVQIALSAIRGPLGDGALGSFLGHWTQLSPSSWTSMCETLDDSGLAPEVIEHFRNGGLLRTGGAVVLDCGAHCPCKRPYELEPKPRPAGDTAPQGIGGWRNRWGRRLKLWQPSMKRKLSSEADLELPALSAEA